MDVLSPKIYLNPEKKGTLFEPKEWEIDRQLALAFHKPTHVGFQIQPDAGKELIGARDVYARVNHVCDCHTLPPPEKLVELGRQAIVAFLYEIGFIEAVDTAYDEKQNTLKSEKISKIIACEFCGERAEESGWEKAEGCCPACGRHPKEEYFDCEHCGQEVHVIEWMEADSRCPHCGKEIGTEMPVLEGAACARCGGPIYWRPDMHPEMDDIWGRFRCWNCGLVDRNFVPYRDP
jgi:DNA-directed RNA polymerase subunit RPC12/RpoP